MKFFILYFFVFSFLYASSQTFCNKIIDLDNNFYTVNNFILKKYKPDSNLIASYSDPSYGNITSVDVSVPFKIILFYKNFDHITILDENLSTETQINLNNYSINAQTVGSANNGKIIIYDNTTKSLLIFDPYRKKIVLSKNINTNDTAVSIFAMSNSILLINKNSVYFFDSNLNPIKIEKFSAKFCAQIKGKLILKDRQNNSLAIRNAGF
jgi:hypothetical protein